MPLHDIETVLDWRGSTVVDRDGEKIGTFEELYLDQADRPAWAAVKTGLFGRRQTFIPLAEARSVGDDLQVPFDKDQVKAAPNIDPDTQLTDDEEQRLYRHYGLPSADARDEGPDARDAARERSSPADQATDAEASLQRAESGITERSPDADADSGEPTEAASASGEADPGGAESQADTPDAMTRSEEELIVGTRRRVRGRARLKKYVVTEHVQKTVPVQREEVRVEYEPAEREDTPPGG